MVFVTGTDTGIGKTWITSQLCHLVRAAGHKVAALKAVESGCSPGLDGVMVGEDDVALVAAAGGWQDPTERCQFRFGPPLAPGVAAEAAGVRIDLDSIAAQVERLRHAADLVLVEGAGGWVVPLGDGLYMADLARAIGAEVLVVARAGLGTINHASLTARAVAADGFRLRAIILSRRPEVPIDAARRNALEIQRATAARVIVSDDLTLSAL